MKQCLNVSVDVRKPSSWVIIKLMMNEHFNSKFVDFAEKEYLTMLSFTCQRTKMLCYKRNATFLIHICFGLLIQVSWGSRMKFPVVIGKFCGLCMYNSWWGILSIVKIKNSRQLLKIICGQFLK